MGKTAKITIRVDPEMKDKLEEMAAVRGASVSSYICSVLSKEIGKNRNSRLDFVKNGLLSATYGRREIECKQASCSRVHLTVLNYVPGRHLDWYVANGVVDVMVRQGEEGRADFVKTIHGVFNGRANNELALLASDKPEGEHYREMWDEEKLAADILDHTPLAEESRKE